MHRSGALKLCLEGCGRHADPKSKNGSRCTECESSRNRIRNSDPKRAAYSDPAYRAIPLSGACVDCGSTEDLTRDHLRPVSLGGTAADGVVIRCRRCNSSKGNR